MNDRSSVSLKKYLDFQDLPWVFVLKSLTEQFNMPYLEADRAVRRFFRRIVRPFSLSWFNSNQISKTDNLIILSICEALSVDSVIINFEKQFAFGLIQYALELELSPELKTHKGNLIRQALVRPKFTLQIANLKVNVDSLAKVLAIQVLLAAFGLVALLAFGVIFVYALAVFIEFVRSPLDITMHATQKASVGLALLCFLVLVAAIFGRAVSNLFSLLAKWFKTKRVLGLL